MSSYLDYSWTEQSDYFYDYCLTLIKDSTPHGVLDALGSHRERLVVHGMKTAFREGYELADDHGVNGVELQLAAVADAGDQWTLMIQMPGFIGVSDDAMAPLTSQHEVVSHQSGQSAGRFIWWSGGERRISFEPLMPYTDLLGVLADRNPAEFRRQILDLMTQAGGFYLEPEPGGNQFHHVPASFALAESLTGVQLTRELLRDLDFIVAVVPLDADADVDPALVADDEEPPRNEEQTSAIRNWATSLGFSVEPQSGQSSTDTDGT